VTIYCIITHIRWLSCLETFMLCSQ